MPVDDFPDPDQADIAFQDAVDARARARNWIDACLGVLTAPIDLSDYDPMSLDAVRQMRTEAARCAGRILRGVAAEPDPTETPE